MNDVVQPAAACDERQRELDRPRPPARTAPSIDPTVYGQSSGLMKHERADARNRRGTATARTARRTSLAKSGGKPVAGDLRADHRRDRVVRREDPRQVRVDAEQHGDAIQVRAGTRRRAPSRVWKPRNGEKPKNTPRANAAAVRSGVSSMCSSVSSQRRTSAASQMNHRKWL